jgi:hypothetical protein
MSHGSMMSDSTSSGEHKIIDIRSIQVILWKESGKCEVSTYQWWKGCTARVRIYGPTWVKYFYRFI